MYTASFRERLGMIITSIENIEEKELKGVKKILFSNKLKATRFTEGPTDNKNKWSAHCDRKEEELKRCMW